MKKAKALQLKPGDPIWYLRDKDMNPRNARYPYDYGEVGCNALLKMVVFK